MIATNVGLATCCSSRATLPHRGIVLDDRDRRAVLLLDRLLLAPLERRTIERWACAARVTPLLKSGAVCRSHRALALHRSPLRYSAIRRVVIVTVGSVPRVFLPVQRVWQSFVSLTYKGILRNTCNSRRSRRPHGHCARHSARILMHEQASVAAAFCSSRLRRHRLLHPGDLFVRPRHHDGS